MKFRHWLAIVAGILPLSLFAVVFFLAIYAWPAIVFNGAGFVVRDIWNLGNLYANPVAHGGTLIQPGAHYGILFLIVGTLLTTAIALLLAVPAGVGSAIFLAEAMSGGLRLAHIDHGRASGGDSERRVRPLGLRPHDPVPFPLCVSCDRRRARIHSRFCRADRQRLRASDRRHRAVADDRAADRRDDARRDRRPAGGDARIGAGARRDAVRDGGQACCSPGRERC